MNNYFTLRKMRFYFICLLLFLPIHLTVAQDNSTEFQYATKNYAYTFPRDHGSHPRFRIEWWYYTGNLKSDTGEEFGIQWTLFRTALSPNKIETEDPFYSNQIYFAHVALANITDNLFFYDEKRSRGFTEEIASSKDLNLKIDTWSVTTNKNTHIIFANTKDFSYKLELTPSKPLIIHGENGVSVKGEDPKNASHYLTYTRMTATGKITLGEKIFNVTGTAWMDHEFSSSQLDKNAIGWDWFSIQLDNNTELMLYFLRDKNGNYLPQSSGTYVNETGEKTDIKFSQLDLKNLNSLKTSRGNSYPSEWLLKIPSLNLELNIMCRMNQTELDTKNSTGVIYYEGPIKIWGQANQKKVSGVGYVEMTGHAETSLQQKL